MKTDKKTNLNSLFNSPLELGLRVLIILSEFKSKELSLQELIYLDYLLIHSNDIDGMNESIHPDIPNRSGELLVKREIIQQGIELMSSRELLTKKFLADGVKYQLTKLGNKYLEALKNNYLKMLKEKAVFVREKFENLTESQLENFINENMAKWGSEFHNESYLHDYLDL